MKNLSGAGLLQLLKYFSALGFSSLPSQVCAILQVQETLQDVLISALLIVLSMPDREWGKVFEKIDLLVFKVIFGPFVVQQVPRARLCCMYQIWTFYCFCHWFVQLLPLQIYKEKPTLNPRDEAEFANFTMQNFKIISPILPAL